MKARRKPLKKVCRESSNQLKAELPSDFEGNSTKVSNWYRGMILYNREINNDWEKIKIYIPLEREKLIVRSK